MSKLLIIDTTYPINTRTERFKKTLKKMHDVYVCAWARKKSPISNGNRHLDFFVYKTNIGYGNQVKKILHLPLFVFFSLRVALKVKPKIVFASHWDSLICAAIIKLFFLGKVKVIYDCLDMPTANNSLLLKGVIKVERFCLKFVDLTIFASRYFKELYPSKIESMVFENYPAMSILEDQNTTPSWFDEKKLEYYKNNNNIAWIGVVRYFDILDNILKAINGTSYLFYVFGDGPELNKLKKKVKEMKMEGQVVFFGRYNYSELKFIYDVSGLVWAAYPTKDRNAVYAISNKYFECSYFNKVPVISKATKMAESLKGNSSVILLDEYSVADIKDKLRDPNDVKSFVKYEPDTTWEEKEVELLSHIKEKICI
jgi:hypothetical protein